MFLFIFFSIYLICGLHRKCLSLKCIEYNYYLQGQPSVFTNGNPLLMCELPAINLISHQVKLSLIYSLLIHLLIFGQTLKGCPKQADIIGLIFHHGPIITAWIRAT